MTDRPDRIDEAAIADHLGISIRMLRLLREIVSEARDADAGMGADVDRPVFVRDAAPLLGISRDTLDRTIASLDEHRRPACLPTPNAREGRRPRRRYYWPNVEALRAWWADVTAKPATAAKPRPARRVLRQDAAITDWTAIAKQIR